MLIHGYMDSQSLQSVDLCIYMCTYAWIYAYSVCILKHHIRTNTSIHYSNNNNNNLLPMENLSYLRPIRTVYFILDFLLFICFECTIVDVCECTKYARKRTPMGCMNYIVYVYVCVCV